MTFCVLVPVCADAAAVCGLHAATCQQCIVYGVQALPGIGCCRPVYEGMTWWRHSIGVMLLVQENLPVHGQSR